MMRKNIIFGAGPTGLYLAIRLHMMGVRDIVVCDPRAGTYTRPGHIGEQPFVIVGRRIARPLNYSKESSHIKDMERQLYEYAISLGIRFEKKKFIRLKSGKKRGVVVQEARAEEFIPCDYVFDCTGPRRDVVQAVNAISEQEPFKISLISKGHPIKRNFIACIAMTKKDFKMIPKQNFAFNSYQVQGTSLVFARNIERLRALGWREFGYPFCHALSNGKMKNGDQKVCLYMDAPDCLPTDLENTWVQTVLKVITNNPVIHFQHLSDSKKYNKKPRFLSFVVDPKELNTAICKQRGIPTVVAQGDAEIEPDFHLGHGMINSFDRVDALIKSMEINDGDISYLDRDSYYEAVELSLYKHRKKIIKFGLKRTQNFIQWLREAKSRYEKAIKATQDDVEKSLFETSLNEIDARIAYHDGIASIEKLRKLPVESNPKERIDLLDEIKLSLHDAINYLSSKFDKEREHAIAELTQCASHENEIAKQYFKKGLFALALKSYQQVLNILELLPENDAHRAEIVEVFSNIILTCRKLKFEINTIGLAAHVLNNYLEPTFRKTREKIVFNVIKGQIDAINRMLMLPENNKARIQSVSQISAFCGAYKAHITPKLAMSLSKELTLIAAWASEVNSKESSNPSLTDVESVEPAYRL